MNSLLYRGVLKELIGDADAPSRVEAHLQVEVLLANVAEQLAEALVLVHLLPALCDGVEHALGDGVDGVV